MARKTIKQLEETIKDLENRLNEQYKINIDLHNKISQMQDLANDSFENSTMYIQVGKEIEQLKAIVNLNEINIKSKKDTIKKQSHTIQNLLKDNEELKNEIQKLKNENNNSERNTENRKAHNERGAGRKEKFSIQEKETMKMYRTQGKTIKEIAELYSCSVGLIHKIINE